MSRSFIKNLAGVPLSEKSKYFQTGNYIVEIRATKCNETDQKTSIIIECEVLGTDSEHDEAPQPGEIAAQGIKISGDWGKLGLSAWKRFLCAVLEIENPDTVTNEQWASWSNEAFDENVMAGIKMYLQVWMTTTKKGGDFTQHKWVRPATDNDLAKFGVK